MAATILFLIIFGIFAYLNAELGWARQQVRELEREKEGDSWQDKI